MKQPYQMTSTEFYEAFPYFIGLSPRAKWRCYRISNKVNLQETGEECTYAEFLEFAVLFRWDTVEAMVLIEGEHSYFVREALRLGDEVPSDVLVEYPDMVDEFIAKRTASKRTQQRRQKHRAEEKKERNFWKNF